MSSNKDDDNDLLLEHVVHLVEEGTRDPTTIEQAVSAYLQGVRQKEQQQASTNGDKADDHRQGGQTSSSSNTKKRPRSKVFDLDTDNYDDEDDDAEAASSPTRRSARLEGSPSRAAKKDPSPKEATDNASPSDNNGDDDDDEDNYYHLDAQDYADIPLGKQGAQMMTTFGDGPHPLPATVAAVLTATRKFLQFAILDARAVRRHEKKGYLQARSSLSTRLSAGDDVQQPVEQTALYQVATGDNRLAFNPKCGFDTDQLMYLFPQEMRAFTRWVDMHDSSAQKSGTTAVAAEEDDEEETNARDKQEEEDESDPTELGGHLKIRARRFDTRTVKMKDHRYLDFSKVRQGSFLPKGRQGSSKEIVAWRQARQTKTKGRKAQASWLDKDAAAVQFLHWVGFDPPAIPPPDDDATNALAFLAYDYFGKVVETALQSNEELSKGHQLTPDDIETAVQDPDILPRRLFGGDDEHQEGNKSLLLPPTQLYFGPGFERRLEAEIDRMVAQDAETLNVEAEQKDQAMLSQMKQPPQVIKRLTDLAKKKK